jgi:predicted PurR-regulated permease PerM
MLHALRGVVLLVILATFFAYLVAPLVRLVQRPFTMRGRERNPPRAFAIGIVYALIFGSIGLALFLLLPTHW